MKVYLTLLFPIFCLAACGGESQMQTQIHTELTAQQQEVFQRLNPEQQEILNQVHQSGKVVDVCVENAVRKMRKKYSCHPELRKHIKVIEKAQKMGVSEKDLKMFVTEELFQ